MPIVLNEWLIHDLRGHNGPVAQAESAEFVSAFQRGTDHIVVLRPSPWTRKAFDMMTVSTPPVHILSRILHLGILQDAQKCRFVEHSEVQPLPPDLARVPGDDAYLFQTALAALVPVIVTTDARLIEVVGAAALARGIQMRTRAQLLDEYRMG